MTSTYSIQAVGRQLRGLHGKKVVMIGGSFDILHIGHLRYLRNAKKLGDILVVALNSDSHIRTYKPIGRPIINELQRAEMLSALRLVDYVFITTKIGLYDPYIYKTIRPDILGLGKEKGRKTSRLKSVEEVRKLYPHLKVAFVNKSARDISTSTIEQRILENNKK